ncbi:uncharacterized protein M421DRAFT_38918, partial [Didymella exigua CBS 183.55]
AYFSTKNTKAKVNYTIYNKEMLAVINTKLRSIKHFIVITNYKNLEYFCKTRLLLERHIR